MAKRTPLGRWFERSGYRQISVAEELGISESYMTLLVNGTRQPSLPLAVKIAELTGLPVEDLIQQKPDVA